MGFVMVEQTGTVGTAFALDTASCCVEELLDRLGLD